MADVFISFIHEERRIARAVQRMLHEKLQEEYRVFLSADTWQIRAVEIWLDRIEQELNEASVLVSLLSPNSIVRPWINFESGAAWLARKAIIPVCYGGLAKGGLPKPYSNFQALDLREEYYYLVMSVYDWLKEKRGLRRLPPMPFNADDPIVVEIHKAIDAPADT